MFLSSAALGRGTQFCGKVWRRRFAGGSTRPPPPGPLPVQTLVPPPPPRPPSDTASASSSTLKEPRDSIKTSEEAGFYVRRALHKKIAGMTRGGFDAPAHIFESFWKFCSQIEPNIADFDACLNALVKSKYKGGIVDSEQLRKLLCLMLERIPLASLADLEESPRNLTNTVWALARLARMQPPLSAEVLVLLPDIFLTVEATARPRLATTFRPRELTLMAWAFAKAGAGTETFFKDLGAAAVPKLHNMIPRELSNLAYAYALMKFNHGVVEQVSTEVVNRAGPHLHPFIDQDIANFVWACASLQVQHSELFQATAVAMEARAHDFSPTGLVNILWAFATLRESAPFVQVVLDRLEDENQCRGLEPRAAANTLWSLATLRHKDERCAAFCMLAAQNCILPQANILHPQDVSNVLWAFTTTRLEHPQLFSALGSRTISAIDIFNHQALGNVAWACARMQVPATEEVLNAIADEALRKHSLKSWSPQSMTTVSWALAESGTWHGDFLTAVSSELQARADAFNDVDLATLAVVFRPHEVWAPGLAGTRRAAMARIMGEASRRLLPRTRDALAGYAESGEC